MNLGSLTLWSRVILVTGQGLDASSTIRATTPAFGGYCTETNGIYGTPKPSATHVVLVKASTIAVAEGLALLLDHTTKSHAVGNVLRSGAGGMGLAQSIHNYVLIKGGRCDRP